MVKRVKERKRKGSDISGNPRNKLHGTYTGYNYHGCSCDRCRKANRDYLLERRAQYAKTGGIPEHVHGTHNGYANYGCRCDECRAGSREYARSLKEKQLGRPMKRYTKRYEKSGQTKPDTQSRKPRQAQMDGVTVGVTWAEPPDHPGTAHSLTETPVRSTRAVAKKAAKKPAKKAVAKAASPARHKPKKTQKPNNSGRVYPWQQVPEELREWWISPWAEHGTGTGYRYWGCRCDLCRDAAAVENRKRKKG